VLALPCGGVPVAYEVARALHVPLDVFLVRKLGVPEHPELAMGALASGGVRVLNEDVVDTLHIPGEVMDEVASAEALELQRRAETYRDGRPPPHVQGRTVILIDDGLATGSTMRAAVVALRQLGPKEIIVAVPVAAADTCASFSQLADETVCLRTPRPFYAVGVWYDDFSQITDELVRELLALAAQEQTAAHH
jgi:predicted phosphoribosyltransferase